MTKWVTRLLCQGTQLGYLHVHPQHSESILQDAYGFSDADVDTW